MFKKKAYGARYPFYAFGIAALFFNIIILFFFISMRIYYRMINKIKEGNYKVFRWEFSQRTIYYFFLAVDYSFILVVGAIWSIIVKQYVMLFMCIFSPLIILCILIFLNAWIFNNFLLLGIVSDYNDKLKVIINPAPPEYNKQDKK